MKNIVMNFDNTFIWVTKQNKETILNKINEMFKKTKTNIVGVNPDMDEGIILFQKNTYTRILKAYGRNPETFGYEFDLDKLKEIDLNKETNIFEYKNIQ